MWFSKQESNVVVTRQMAEVENNDQPPQPAPVPVVPVITDKRADTKTATRHRPIDVVTVDPQPEMGPDGPEAAFSSANRVSKHYVN